MLKPHHLLFIGAAFAGAGTVTCARADGGDVLWDTLDTTPASGFLQQDYISPAGYKTVRCGFKILDNGDGTYFAAANDTQSTVILKNPNTKQYTRFGFINGYAMGMTSTLGNLDKVVYNLMTADGDVVAATCNGFNETLDIITHCEPAKPTLTYNDIRTNTGFLPAICTDVFVRSGGLLGKMTLAKQVVNQTVVNTETYRQQANMSLIQPQLHLLAGASPAPGK